MTLQRKRLMAPEIIWKTDKPGTFRAVFSTLNEIDYDNDVTLPGAFKEGQEVRIAAWAHDWDSLPVGKGVISSNSKQAWVDGEFFLDTDQGKQTYLTVKNLGSLQEWSYGFSVEDQSHGQFEGTPVRFLKALDVVEVSPVMKGAGRHTGTAAIKGLKVNSGSSYEDLIEELTRAARELARLPLGGTAGWVRIEATYPDYVIICVISPDEMLGVFSEAEKYYRASYTIDATGAVQLGAPIEVEETWVPVGTANQQTELRAQWTAAFINDLPDSAFAYIEPGGTKDDQGKTTPRSLRHFPHHGSDGAIDAPHTRNAAARIPQSDISAEAKATAERHIQRHIEALNAGKAQRPLESEMDAALTAVVDLGKRLKALAALKAVKEGRVLSAANLARITQHRDNALSLRTGLDQHITEMTALIDEHTPKSPEKTVVRSALAEIMRFQAIVAGQTN